MEKEASGDKLARSLGLFQATAIVIGTTIGSGVFFKPAKVFLHAGGTFAGIMAWVVSGLITLCAALTTAEIATAIPETGGMYTYLRKLYGERTAFLLGWAQSLIYTPATVAAISVMFARYMATMMPMSEVSVHILTLFVITVMVITNCLSVKIGGRIQSLATVLKLIPLFLMILAGLFLGKISTGTAMASTVEGGLGFGSALIACLWAYDGWNTVANMGGEMKKPEKDLPRSMIIGLGIIISVYVLLNAAIARVLPLETIVSQGDTAVKLAADMVLGKSGSMIISIGILISLYGSLNGYFLSGVRIPYTMGVNNLIPFSEKFAGLNKAKSPIFSNIFTYFLTVIYAMSGSFTTLSNLVVFILWVFFVLMVMGVFRLRKREDLHASYRVPLYPIIPAIGILGGIYILYSSFTENWVLSLTGIAITLSGLIVYESRQRKLKKTDK